MPTALCKTGKLTDRRMTRTDALRMIWRRAAAAGIATELGCHSFRATGMTVYLQNGGLLEHTQQMARLRECTMAIRCRRQLHLFNFSCANALSEVKCLRSVPLQFLKPMVLKSLFLGICIFIPLAFSGVWKRALILGIGIVVSFSGPLFALSDLPDLHGTKWFWDALAAEANKNNEYKDVILAVIPVAFVCFTDFMNHVLDDEYHFTDFRSIYTGIFTILAILVLATAALPFSFAQFASSKSTTWLGNFDESWGLAKFTVELAFIFEISLGCVEAVREARRVTQSQASTVAPNKNKDSSSKIRAR